MCFGEEPRPGQISARKLMPICSFIKSCVAVAFGESTDAVPIDDDLFPLLLSCT